MVELQGQIKKLEKCIGASVDDYASVVNAPPPPIFLRTVKINIFLTYIEPSPPPPKNN